MTLFVFTEKAWAWTHSNQTLLILIHFTGTQCGRGRFVCKTLTFVCRCIDVLIMWIIKPLFYQYKYVNKVSNEFLLISIDWITTDWITFLLQSHLSIDLISNAKMPLKAFSVWTVLMGIIASNFLFCIVCLAISEAGCSFVPGMPV